MSEEKGAVDGPIKPDFPIKSGGILYEYKVLGGKWHEVENEVASYLNNGTGWVLQGGVVFVEYHTSQDQAYIGQAIYREVTVP